MPGEKGARAAPDNVVTTRRVVQQRRGELELRIVALDANEDKHRHFDGH